jgi:intracellular septation protein
MKFLYDLLPLLLFFAAFKYYDIYTATAVAIVASFMQVGLFWFKHRRFETMQIVTLAVIAVFGGMTLLLHDETFIKWKPTLVYWILSILLFGSQWLGKRTIIERMLGAQITVPDIIWKRLNLSWGFFFAVLGLLNIYVAFYYALDQDAETRRNIWVNFKVFGLLGITLVFTVAQAFFMAKHIGQKPEAGESTPDKAAD